MGVDVAKDCQEINVHHVSFARPKGSVYYASLPCGPCAAETLKGCRMNRAGDKHRLVSILWDHTAATESSLWKCSKFSNRAAFPLQVVCGVLGRPHLMVGECRGPAISFSEGGGKVWAALCGDDSEIGIDVAGTNDFQREYPFHRVFHAQEIRNALGLADGNLEKASALLWSIKEAVVKALGCAFHLVDPRQITVYPSMGEEGIYTFPVGLSKRVLVQFPIGVSRSIWVRSFPQATTWLSIALFNRQP